MSAGGQLDKAFPSSACERARFVHMNAGGSLVPPAIAMFASEIKLPPVLLEAELGYAARITSNLRLRSTLDRFVFYWFDALFLRSVIFLHKH